MLGYYQHATFVGQWGYVRLGDKLGGHVGASRTSKDGWPQSRE